MSVRAFLASLTSDRRTSDRRSPAMTCRPDEAAQFIRENKYTGWYITHCAQGVPTRIEFPNPMQIQLSR